MNAPAKTAADALLEQLAEQLAPRVARILRERAGQDSGDAALAELLAKAGYELDSGAP